jgi:hypothetical protein
MARTGTDTGTTTQLAPPAAVPSLGKLKIKTEPLTSHNLTSGSTTMTKITGPVFHSTPNGKTVVIHQHQFAPPQTTKLPVISSPASGDMISNISAASGQLDLLSGKKSTPPPSVSAPTLQQHLLSPIK